ncbi:MAG: kelch repeat-containing protein [Flavisolibacter sp.]
MSFNYIKSVGLVLMMTLIGQSSSAQPGYDTSWHWMNGDYITNARTIYHLIIVYPWVPMPGARSHSASWTDSEGNFWLMGGFGFDGHGRQGSMNDLWKNPIGNFEWIWISGDDTSDAKTVYGNLGVADGANKPGGRNRSFTWTDNSGNLWMFGGKYSVGGYDNYLSDLWKFEPATNQWTWVNGDSAINQPGVNGVMGVASSSNHPGARSGGVIWKDLSGNLWMFGGFGYASSGGPMHVNDLWKYDIATNQWTWMKGYPYVLGVGVYGLQGVPDPANTPGSRYGSVAWTDASGKFWLWGGNGVSETPGGFLNDLWRYDPSTSNWTWMKGNKTNDPRSSFGSLGMAGPQNTPGGREGSYSWIDNWGDLWLFGGFGVAPFTAAGYLNDLWRYQPESNNWTWMKGDTLPNMPSRHNVGGVPNFINLPGSRSGGSSCMRGATSTSSIFVMFGGDVSGFSQMSDMWAIGTAQLVLPLQLVDFYANQKDHSIRIEWTTAGEQNFSHFNLQRSVNGNLFKTIATVEGNKQYAPNRYFYDDASLSKPLPHKIYYRLEMVDIDGSSSLSRVALITPTEGRTVLISSNPVHDLLHLYIAASGSELIKITITDASGKMVSQIERQLQTGSSTIELPVSDLNAGLYMLDIQSNSGRQTLKFVKI